jgi:phage terminase small subunit
VTETAKTKTKGKRKVRVPVLNAQQEKFCQQYALLHNASEALRIAYPQWRTKENQAVAVRASNLLREEKIRERVTELEAIDTQKLNSKYGITKDRILQELASIGFSNVSDVVDWGESIAVTDPETGEVSMVHGIKIKGRADIPLEALAAIAEIGETKEGRIKVKMHEKRGALVDMGKTMGLFKEPERDTTININLSERLRSAISQKRAARIAINASGE